MSCFYAQINLLGVHIIAGFCMLESYVFTNCCPTDEWTLLSQLYHMDT